MKILCFEIIYVGFKNQYNKKLNKRHLIYLIKKEGKLSAIKYYRECVKNIGLKESKEFVEDFALKRKLIFADLIYHI